MIESCLIGLKNTQWLPNTLIMNHTYTTLGKEFKCV